MKILINKKTHKNSKTQQVGPLKNPKLQMKPIGVAFFNSSRYNAICMYLDILSHDLVLCTEYLITGLLPLMNKEAT